mmetsp:Transcript_7214/g.18486  ORF Transcript_7214/g.18486 Transcript_7214/m.18486 type:complete len:187 (-) Transcript_7214:366-926(-)
MEGVEEGPDGPCQRHRQRQRQRQRSRAHEASAPRAADAPRRSRAPLVLTEGEGAAGGCAAFERLLLHAVCAFYGLHSHSLQLDPHTPDAQPHAGRAVVAYCRAPADAAARAAEVSLGAFLCQGADASRLAAPGACTQLTPPTLTPPTLTPAAALQPLPLLGGEYVAVGSGAGSPSASGGPLEREVR